MTIYIDVLFIINFVINYTLLCLTGKISKAKTSKIRIFSGAFLGALYAVFMFFPQIKMLYGVLAKLSVSLIIVFVSFKITKWILFIKTVFIFYVSGFVFGGVVLGVFYFTNAGLKYGSALNNGIFYFNFPWKILFASVGLAYIVAKIGFSTYKTQKNINYEEIKVNLKDKEAVLNALVDTGNMLLDPIENTPVIVASLASVKDILPLDMVDLIDKNTFANTNIFMESESFVKAKIRLIPFSSLGKKDGMLIGFKPDFIVIRQKRIENVCIGVYNQSLSKSGVYNALISPELINF